MPDDNTQDQQAQVNSPTVAQTEPALPSFTMDEPAADSVTTPTDEPTSPPVTDNSIAESVVDSPVSLATEPTPAADSSAVTPAVDDDLISIKQQALQQLSPLVGHLDQSPEEKFRTTMMMIQASDDQSLVKSAYESAQSITDEKAKAQALLDIVNEINYFTQNGK